MSQPTYTIVTIANAGTVSSAYETKGATRGSFQLPAAFTGTNLAIHGSNDNSTFTAVPVEGNEAATMTVAASGCYVFHVKSFCFRYLRFVVDAQAAARTLTVCTRD